MILHYFLIYHLLCVTSRETQMQTILSKVIKNWEDWVTICGQVQCNWKAKTSVEGVDKTRHDEF